MRAIPTHTSESDTLELTLYSHARCFRREPGRQAPREHRVQTARRVKSWSHGGAGPGGEVMVNETRKGRRSEGQFASPWRGRCPWWLSAVRNPLQVGVQCGACSRTGVTGGRYSLQRQSPFKGDAMTVVKSRAVFEYRSECAQLSWKRFSPLKNRKFVADV